MSTTSDSSPAKPTGDWVIGDEPMTGPQRSYLHTLAREAGEDIPDRLTQAEASEAIDRLQQVTGRGGEHVPHHGDPSPSPTDVADRIDDAGIVDEQAIALGELEQAD